MLLLVTASIIWAFSFGLIKGMMPHVDPFILATLRLGFAALIGVAFLRPSAVNAQISRQFFGVGFIQLGLMYAPYMLSFRYLKAHEVALFTMTSPIYLVAISQLARRAVEVRTIAAAALAVAGGAVVTWRNVESDGVLVGASLVQLANFMFAYGQWLLIGYQFKAKTTFLTGVPFYFFGAFSGSLVCLVFSGHALDIFAQSFSAMDWLIFAWLGIISSGLGFVVWNLGAFKVNLAQLAVAMDIKLPIAVFISLVVFGESTDVARLVIGGTILLIATLVARTNAKSRVFPP
ncbi:MAG: DMT family transporter [Proteobacteria bacterium]|nr:DMT family transporter [Pseudomonadota bacterium]